MNAIVDTGEYSWLCLAMMLCSVELDVLFCMICCFGLKAMLLASCAQILLQSPNFASHDPILDLVEGPALKRGCCPMSLIFPDRLQIQIASSLSTTDTPPLSLVLHDPAQTRPPPHAFVCIGVPILVYHGLQFRDVLGLEFCVWGIWYGLKR